MDEQNSRDNSDKWCPICLTTISGRSLADPCLHEFCFDCLMQWSSGSNRCPICRQSYHHIIYDIVSEQYFHRLPVEEHRDVDANVDDFIHRIVLHFVLQSISRRSGLKRDQMSQDLHQMRKRFNRLSTSNRKTQEIAKEIQRLEAELQILDANIHQLNVLLDEENPSEADLMDAINRNEDQLLDSMEDFDTEFVAKSNDNNLTIDCDNDINGTDEEKTSKNK